MDVRLSPEQQALRDSAAQVVDRLGPRAVGQLDDRERAGKLAAAVAASGWYELRAAEPAGGPVASGVEVAIVAEELGRGLADVAFLGPTLAAELRRLAGAPDATAPETVLLDAGLTGLATAVEGAVAIDAGAASTALTLRPGPGGLDLAEVTLAPPAIRTDLTRAFAVPAGPALPVAGAARPLGPEDVARWTSLGLASTVADLVGVMRGAVSLATEYAAARIQYGTAIGSFQAVQHLLADAYVSMEGSRSAALHAAWAVDAMTPGDALAAAALAKAYSARAARAVGEAVIQVHGGIGNTWECLAHVYLRRALLSIDTFGGVGPSLERVLDHHGIGS